MAKRTSIIEEYGVGDSNTKHVFIASKGDGCSKCFANILKFLPDACGKLYRYGDKRKKAIAEFIKREAYSDNSTSPSNSGIIDYGRQMIWFNNKCLNGFNRIKWTIDRNPKNKVGKIYLVWMSHYVVAEKDKREVLRSETFCEI